MGKRTFEYIKDFLTNRTTRLVAGELQLPLKHLGSTGTPQGSVISPLLFNLVMIGVARRLERIKDIKHTIYADDITLWSTGGSDSQIEATLQEAVNAVEEHLRPTGLKCSPTKSELLVIPPQNTCRTNTQHINVVTQDGMPIPHVQTLRVLGLHIQDLNHNGGTIQKLQAKLALATRLLRKVATRYQGMKEDSLLRLTQSFAISHIAYVASFHNWKAAERIKIDAMIRKVYKTALGLYPHTNTERMLSLGVHNTLEEIAEAQWTAQYHRLSQTKTGRAILQRIGLNVPATTPEEAAQLPREVMRRLKIPPLPKHMHPQIHQERRTARAEALTKCHAKDPRAYYVDVAKYPHRPNTYAAAVISADKGVLTASSSIRCKTPTQAEEFAIALALTIPDCRTVLSDSKPAIVNYATNNVNRTTTKICSTLTRSDDTVTVKWFPAHAGKLEAGPNRNEGADTEAHALTSRGPPPTPSSGQRRPAEDEKEEYSITTYGEVLQWYRTNRCRFPPPHKDLQRKEAATLRQLQVQAIWTPVWAKHVCPEAYPTDVCQHCKKARATQRHLLWDCAPPPGNQGEEMPPAISSKIISRESGNQRDAVQRVLGILERQRPKAAPLRV